MISAYITSSERYIKPQDLTSQLRSFQATNNLVDATTEIKPLNEKLSVLSGLRVWGIEPDQGDDGGTSEATKRPVRKNRII